ncbi:MAG: hypothetical protein K0S65_1445 [Labilithrix sp.]|nr:hypothetical protein [Labilithrix sp.]
MDTGAGLIALGFVALLIATSGLVVAVLAYRRAGAQDRLAPLRPRAAAQLARVLGETLDESLIRVKRAQMRLAEVAERAAPDLRLPIDDLNRQIAELRMETEQTCVQLRSEASSRALEAQESLAARIRHVEANIEVLHARAEIALAEELAARGEYLEAEALLEDAVARFREVKLRLSDIVGDDPAFAPVIETLNEALHALRVRARDHKRQLDTVLSASDALLAWLKSREPRGAATVAAGA